MTRKSSGKKTDVRSLYDRVLVSLTRFRFSLLTALRSSGTSNTSSPCR